MSIGIGDSLREAREAQGRSQQEAAQALRVRSDYVEALEAEQFQVFGADTYARGHLRNYANLLGLDPQPLLDTYDRYVRTEDQTAHHFADAPIAMSTREPLPRWVSVLGGTIVVLLAIALIGMLGSNAPDSASPSLDDGVTATGSETPSGATPTETTEPTPTPTPTPTYDGVEMLLIVESDCWMEITVDGQAHQRSGTVIAAGETLELRADQVVELTLGNAGGVLVEVNGQSYGRPGGNGEVVRGLRYGPDGPMEGDGEA